MQITLCLLNIHQYYCLVTKEMWELHSTQCFLHSTQCFYGEGRRFLVQGRIVCLWYCCNYHFSSKTDNVSRGLIKVALLNCSLFFGLQLDKVFEFFAQQLLCFIPKEFTSHIICSKDLEYTATIKKNRGYFFN